MDFVTEGSHKVLIMVIINIPKCIIPEEIDRVHPKVNCDVVEDKEAYCQIHHIRSQIAEVKYC